MKDKEKIIAENKSNRKPLWHIMLIVSVIISIGVLVFIAIYAGTFAFNDSLDSPQISENTYVNGHSRTTISSDNNHVDGITVSHTIKTGYSDGYSSTCLENTFIRTYKEFKRYVRQFGKITINDVDILEYFDKEYFENHTLAIEVHDTSKGWIHYEIDTITENEHQINVNINQINGNGGPLAPSIAFNFIELGKDVEYVNFNITIIRNNSSSHTPGPDWADVIEYKPIIYLYPTEETTVNVQLCNRDALIYVYPAYNNGWTVSAKPNGDLTDLSTGRYQYGLYYESICPYPYVMTDTGFVVKGKDTISFLEEKLAILGLTEREADEFIIYWLPQLASNNYNYVRFATIEEIGANMPLNIQPKPDSVIRVMMVFKALDEPIDIQEQILTTPERNGFTVVEWGGTKLP